MPSQRLLSGPVVVFLAIATLFVGCEGVNAPEAPVDEATAQVHSVLSLPALTRPTITITNEYLDRPYSAATGITIPSGVPLTFCWTAEASEGRSISTYRYGWDIFDTIYPFSWDVDLTPYDGSKVCTPSHAYEAGQHFFGVEVVDDAGESTILPMVISVKNGPSSFDIMPGSCKNPLSPRRNGRIRTAVPGRIGMELDDIDTASLRLWIDGNVVRPVRTRVADVTTTVINRDPCTCPPQGPDGYDDLVLFFEAADVTAALGPVSNGDNRSFSIRGSMVDGSGFDRSDCITIVGNPPGDDDPPLLQKDAVIVAVQNGYNDKDYHKVASALDDDFTFFFSPEDLSSGKVSFSQWDRDHELAATAKLFDIDVPAGDALRIKPARNPSEELHGTWGQLKSLFFNDVYGGRSTTIAALTFAEGEENWIEVTPSDPDRYPGEVWYEKTAGYFVLASVTDLLYIGSGYSATFVVRYSASKGYWQLVEWRDIQ